MFIVYEPINEDHIGPFETMEDAVHFATTMENELGEPDAFAIIKLSSPQEWYEDVVVSQQTMYQEV